MLAIQNLLLRNLIVLCFKIIINVIYESEIFLILKFYIGWWFAGRTDRQRSFLKS